MSSHKLIRAAMAAAESQGLEVLEVKHGRHAQVHVRCRATGHTGYMTLGHGSDPNYREASLRSQARSIARGTYKGVRL